MEVTEYFNIHADKSSGVLTSVTTTTCTVDLSFLTDRERATILKVIKADLELKRNTLGYLKKVVEAGRQFQTAQKFTDDFTKKCACCGKGFYHAITGKRNSLKSLQCQQCKHAICEKCERIQNGEVVCIVCFREKLYMLQSMDFLPVFHRKEVSSDREDTLAVTDDSAAVEPLYGSDLLKRSLELTRKRIMFASKGEGTLSLNKPKMSLDLSTDQAEKEDKLVPAKPVYSTSIHDPNSGFKLIKEMKAEEDLVDLCSLYSEPCDPIDYKISGRIMFGVWYRTEEHILYIRISKLEKLFGIKDGTADPYVKTYLLPGKNKLLKRRTGIHRGTIKPEINELLKYGNISEVEIRKKILWISVWHWDRYGRNQFLGEVRLPLSSLDLTDSTDKWYTLQDKTAEDETDSPEKRGRILVSLKYDPNVITNESSSIKDATLSAGKLLIQIQKAEDLILGDTTCTINPFARCYLLPNRFIDSKKKSTVISNTVNPVWNSEFMFHHIAHEDLESSRVLEITVWDEDRRGVNQFIGGIRLGPDPLTSMNVEWMDSIGEEITHWEDMLARPGEWVEQWHYLRPTMDSLHGLEEKEELFKSVSDAVDTVPSDACSEYDSSDSCVSSRESSPDNLPEIQPKPLNYSKSFHSKKPRKGNYTISGEILVNVEYKGGEIVAYIDRAVGIAAANNDGTSDSYVKTYLLPNRKKASKRKSEVQKRTIDPLYNATLKYKVPFEQLGTRAIWLTVWNVSRFGHRLFLGEVCIPLTSLNLKQPTEKWYKLNDATETEIPGLVAPTAPVFIEEDLVARTPLAYRNRSTAVTTASIRSKSGSPRVALGTKSASLEYNSPIHTIGEEFRSKSASPPDDAKTSSSFSLEHNSPVHMAKDHVRSKTESPDVSKHASSLSLDHSSPLHTTSTSKTTSLPDVNVNKHRISVSPDHKHSVDSDDSLFPAFVESKMAATAFDTAAATESIEDFRSKSTSTPDVSVNPPSPTSTPHSEDDLFPADIPPRRRSTAITERVVKKEILSASNPDVSAASSGPHDSKEDLFLAGPHRIRTTVTMTTRPTKSFRSKSASPPVTTMSPPPKIIVEDSETKKWARASFDTDLFSGFTSYHNP